MYREKLGEKIVKLENLQLMCAKEHPEVALAVSDKIMELVIEADRYDRNHSAEKTAPSELSIPVSVNGVIIDHIKVEIQS